MASQQVLQVNGTQLLFNDQTDFPNSGDGPPTTPNNSLIIGSPTTVLIDLTSLSAAAARQSDKTLDLGAAWPGQWLLGACLEFVSAPTAGGTVEFWWNGTPGNSASVGNSGGASGNDGVFAVVGTPQLKLLGALTVIDNASVIQINGVIRLFKMPYRQGSLIVYNRTDTAFHTVMDETHVVITPIIPDIQDAV